MTTLMMPEDRAREIARTIRELRDLAANAASAEEAREIKSRLAQISRKYQQQSGVGLPPTPVDQAVELEPTYRRRPHLEYLSDQIADAVRDVEGGKSRMLAVSMPPRAGKSYLISRYTPLWLLRRHPEWEIITASYDRQLTTEWARDIREIIEEHPELGIALKKDGGAGGRWETVEGGGMFATAVRGAMTGRGARVLLIDDPVKDFVEAHSARSRQQLWEWWLSVAQTRLMGPYLVIVVMTRWHEDDFVGRVLSTDYAGDPKDWTRIVLPALSEGPGDPLGRSEGEPLLAPTSDEDAEHAMYRWNSVRSAVGEYTWSSMYQQRPAPASGAIFDSSKWKFWTNNPTRARDDGSVVYVEPSTFVNGRWLDSWDCTFKGADGASTDYVVGQRWVRNGPNRYLVAQQRGRWSFTQTIDRMRLWTDAAPSEVNPAGHLVHERLIEEKANGAAIIDVLKEHVSGIKPVNPTVGKEGRARAITPEIESGHVYLPHPDDEGNEWVNDLLGELRDFPHSAHDDMVDALTQALAGLRDPGRGRITVPGVGATGVARGPAGMLASRQIVRSSLGQGRRYGM